MPVILYVDTALSGRWNYASDAPPQEMPYLVRLSWLLDDGVSLQESCHLIEVPAAVRMSAETSAVTGIFDHSGPRVSLSGAMTEFLLALSLAERSVAYGARHHSAVLDHAVTYRLGHPRPPWPPMDCAMQAAVALAQYDEVARDATHNMTSAAPRRRPGQYLRFEDAAAARGFPLMPGLNPISAGYRRAWAVRKIWQAYEELGA